MKNNIFRDRIAGLVGYGKTCLLVIFEHSVQ